MRRALLVAMAAVLLAGCGKGLSLREGSYDFPMMLYELKGPDAPAPFRPAAPLSVAVAQVGEVAPEQGLIDGLRARKDVFARVSAIPLPPLGDSPYGRVDNIEPRRTRANEAVGRALKLARNVGATHALIVGGCIDTSWSSTWAAPLNILILPLWLVPSADVKASGKCAAALVDVASGQVVTVSTRQATDSAIVPMAYADGQEDVLTGKLRTRLAADVAQQVADDVKAAGGR